MTNLAQTTSRQKFCPCGPIFTDISSNCVTNTLITNEPVICRNPTTIDVGPDCSAGNLIVDQNGLCRLPTFGDVAGPITTETVNIACTYDTIIIDILGNCRPPLTTDVNTNCGANQFIGANTDGTTCVTPTTVNIGDGSCTTNTLINNINANGCTSPITTDVNSNCDNGAFIVANTGNCRDPITTDVNTNCGANQFIGANTDGTTCVTPTTANIGDGSCTANTLINNINANGCTSPITTDVNSNCDNGAFIVANTGNCRDPLTTDVNINCGANQFIGASTDGTTCITPTTVNIGDGSCTANTLINNINANSCTSPITTDVDGTCTLGQIVDTGLTSCRAVTPIDAGSNCITGNVITDQNTNNACAAPATVLVTDIDNTCTNGNIIGDATQTGDGNVCTGKVCLTVTCDQCPSGICTGLNNPLTIEYTGLVDDIAGYCQFTACGWNGNAVGGTPSCDLEISLATSC